VKYYIHNILLSLVLLAITGAASRGLAAETTHLALIQREAIYKPLNPLAFPRNPWRPVEEAWPEYYINPLLSYGLDEFLPSRYRQKLNLEAGFDRWAGVPTFSADYLFIPGSWGSTRLHVTPKVSFDSGQESYALDAGIRRLVSSRFLVGVHVFHDWVRPRGSRAPLLGLGGAGFEISALPGRFSDLTISANAYIPTRTRHMTTSDRTFLLEESLPKGADIQVGVVLPSLTEYLDVTLEGQGFVFEGGLAPSSGYRVGLALGSRDGMLGLSVSQGQNRGQKSSVEVQASLNLTADWNALARGDNPFSPPRAIPRSRYERDLALQLEKRPERRHKMPITRSRKRMALVTDTHGEVVSFSGGFPQLSHAELTAQTSQSPWQNRGTIFTDEHGCYSGTLRLPPGEYLFRVIHKASGKASRARRITVRK
jgi:hypothetical protein